MTRILFVCTGNTCRSPMAEALLVELARQKGLAVHVRSAGISTVNGLPVSANAVQSLNRRGISHEGSSLSLAEEAVDWADFIFTMTAGHKMALLQRFPDMLEKTYTLKEFAYMDEQLEQQINELEALYTELQMQQALGKPLEENMRRRLLELERLIPEFDVADPFGGSQKVYDECSDEIENAVFKLVDKLINWQEEKLS